MENLRNTKIRLSSNPETNAVIFSFLKMMGVDPKHRWDKWDDCRRTPDFYFINGSLDLSFDTGDSFHFESHSYSEFNLDEAKAEVKCIKSFPGTNVGDVVTIPFKMFDPEFFGSNETRIDIEFEGYELEIHRGSEQVNWGCRSFTFDEINQINNVFQIFQSKDLHLGISRYMSNFNNIDFNKIDKLSKAISKK
jgi:hypothetical protein